eukprot:CAMPEP_0117569404 /NCGR_PEP_ID=MMETSP0784-20121206/58639_1 /TAXON_ID=39447 /ORGANISM="" /LENGTH=60 /DNA_ID=CAMNT_0005367373 /DNA_START=443 /DNA_END=626 /DNA_ORIENTATION=+
MAASVFLQRVVDHEWRVEVDVFVDAVDYKHIATLSQHHAETKAGGAVLARPGKLSARDGQ